MEINFKITKMLNMKETILVLVGFGMDFYFVAGCPGTLGSVVQGVLKLRFSYLPIPPKCMHHHHLVELLNILELLKLLHFS